MVQGKRSELPFVEDPDVFALQVFPAADIFPMLADDEMLELARDIKANGLREPLVIAEVAIAGNPGDKEWMLIDGRNRRKACQIAEVKPTLRRLNGEDHKGFVLSANVHRRHLSKGQRAMAVAMILPEEEDKRTPGKKGKTKTSAETAQLSYRRVAEARQVLRSDPDLALMVLKGLTPLDDALETIRKKQSDDTSKAAKLERLRLDAPDLATLVDDERMDIDEARSALSERDRKKNDIREGGLHAVRTIASFTGWITSLDQATALAKEELKKARALIADGKELGADDERGALLQLAGEEREKIAQKRLQDLSLPARDLIDGIETAVAKLRAMVEGDES